MDITILGSGTILSKERNPSGYFLQSKELTALIDCGPGIYRRITELNIDVITLSAIFLSHFHVDHYSDVLAVLMRRYLKNKEINKNLTIFGPIGLKYWFETQSKLHGIWLSDNIPVLNEMSRSRNEFYDLTVFSCPTIHTQNSIAFKLTQDKKSIFYSSDTDYDPDLAEFASNCDLAILECSYNDENPAKGHLTPAKVAKFVNIANPQKTILTHIYPENDTADLLQRVSKFTSNEIQIGNDLMKLKV